MDDGLRQHAIRSLGAKRIRDMLWMARSEPDVLIKPEQLDQDPWLLNCPNGTVNLRTGELQEHSREKLITKLCPTRYEPEAESYHWDRFLEGVFQSQSLIDFMRRFCGYGLTGNVSEQVLLILHGCGSNGKSTFLNTWIDTIGSDYAMKADANLLMSKKQEGHSTEKMDLFGKRFVACSESEEHHRLAESFVKDLTGGESIRGRRMREDNWEYKPTHKIVLSTNHVPTIHGTDYAIWRRIRLVPFAVHFWNPDEGEIGPPELERDKSLPDRLKAEAEGILAWAVRGCLEWQRDGLGMPAEVKAATADYRSEQDVIGSFLDECCIIFQTCKVRSSALYEAYKGWCEQSGDSFVNQRRFGRQMTERGFQRVKNDGVWYCGIGLKESRRNDL